MKFVYVDHLPEGRSRKAQGKLQQAINMFCNSDKKIAKVDWKENGYKTLHSCRTGLYAAIRRSGHPVRVVTIKDEVYLVKQV